jgi:hypothetical protein
MKSEDRGHTWTSIAGDLPVRSGAWSVVQDHVNPDLLFVGLEFGVWFTVDGGGHWIQLQGGIPSIQARDLHIQGRENDLVVGTFGRGAYILDDYSALRTVSAKALAADAWLFSPRPAYLYGERGYVAAAWGNETTANPPYGALLTYHVGEALAGDTTLVLVVSDEAGERVRSVPLPAGGSIRRVAWDLRRDPPLPPDAEVDSRRRRPRQGDLVEPGRYTARLGRMNGAEFVTLSGPRDVRVIRITP